jgi:hypothetical protein
MSSPSFGRRCLAAGVGLILGAAPLIWAAPGHAEVPIKVFEQRVSTTQAGGHPDLRTRILVANRSNQNVPAPSCNCQDPKELNIESPAGVIADPRALPQCTAADFAENHCPIDTQVGVSYIGGGAINEVRENEPVPEPDGTFVAGKYPSNSFPIPVFNLEPHPGQTGLIGFLAPFLEFPIYLVASARTESDYGLNLRTAGIFHAIPLSAADITLWGVPADPIHDPLRLGPLGCNTEHQGGKTAPPCQGRNQSNAPETPFLSNPTTCGGVQTTSLEVIGYDHSLTEASVPYPATTGCDQLSFNPSLFGQPTTAEADSPSGFDVDLSVPQETGPTVPSPSEIRNSSVTLPEGFSINANAVDGKTSCSDRQANIGIRDLPAECPETSKIGTLTITSSSLPGPMPGFVYIGESKPGARYRVLLVADGFGAHVKLPGIVHADPETGRITMTFNDLPQFPFSLFNIHLFGSERGVLATPTRCGTYAVDSTFGPWDSALPDQSSLQFFGLNSGPNGLSCPQGDRPFAPGFLAGVSDKTAGLHTPFALEVNRSDGEQNLTGLDIRTPPGFSATLRDIPYCPEAAISKLSDRGYSGLVEQASPACPAASQIGTATASAGAGTRPVYVSGKVYLAGPYKGSPLSLVVVIPAVSGPYDLGNVAVRTAIEVDPNTAQVTARSDPLPQIIEGIPLRTRWIRINLDRPEFALNPTNCRPLAVNGTITGSEGATAGLNQHFQVANCADLPFAPKLNLSLVGGVKRLGHPAIRAVFSQEPGEANARRVSITLPPGELLDQSHIKTICTREQFAREACPGGSMLGDAVVTTPLLSKPLEGPVYLRSSSHRLPDMVLDLQGQVDLQLSARIDSVNDQLRTTFETVPDAPVSSVVVTLAGGSKGLLENEGNLCRARKSATVRMAGQNNRHLSARTVLRTHCTRKQPTRHQDQPMVVH